MYIKRAYTYRDTHAVLGGLHDAKVVLIHGLSTEAGREKVVEVALGHQTPEECDDVRVFLEIKIFRGVFDSHSYLKGFQF